MITQETADNSSRESDAYWLKHARGISAQLIKIVTCTPRRFLDDLYYSFPKSKTDSLFTNPRNELARFRKALHCCERIVLNAYGCGKEFRELEEINQTVKLMEDYIDDILMALLEGKDIEQEHQSSRLLYQKDRDIVLKHSWKSIWQLSYACGKLPIRRKMYFLIFNMSSSVMLAKVWCPESTVIMWQRAHTPQS